MISNNKGITLVESLIAIFLTAVAIVSLMPMQDISLRTGARADYLGRASYIMQSELEIREYFIMNQNNAIVLAQTVPFVKGFTLDGVLTTVAAERYFTVNTLINPVAGATNAWIINVQVTWPHGPTNGIKSSLIATRHYNFDQ
ncbi:MAG: hypothetical protein R6W75_05880 [Smithellaceae bacterium]